MKKIYIFLFLATNVAFVSCMEKERRDTYDYNKTAPVFITQPNTLTTQRSSATNSPYTWQPSVCEANQPGWQQLNAIANMTYHNYQSTTMDEVELKPIYRPMSTTTTQKETKPLLQTNPSQPDKAIMQELYSNACHITSLTNSHINTQKDQYEKLITLINDMRNAKNNGIYEDLMIKFAYTKERMLPTYFFSRLKRYNQREEPLPNINDLITTKKVPQIKNELAHILDIPSPYNTTTTTQHINNHEIKCKYPALLLLKMDITSSHSYTNISALFSYIYSTAENTQNDYVGLSYDDLKNKFYELAYYVVKHCTYMPEARQRNKDRIYDLLKIIEAGTTLNPQKQEDDFGYDMITKELTMSERLSTVISPTFLVCDNIPRIKKYIGLLCSLIKKYNKKRETRYTPTKEQMLAYKAYERLDIALPDSFDTTLFDTTIYAFKELTELSENISCLSQLELCKIDQNLVDECVQYLYKNAI